VGEDVARRVDDEAGPEALRLVGGVARRPEEALEGAEEVVKGVVLAPAAAAGAALLARREGSTLHLLGARDVHHRGGHVLGQPGEVRQVDRRGGGRGAPAARLLGATEDADRLAAR